MILQPIIENAITHGLEELNTMLADEVPLAERSMVQKCIGLANSCLRLREYFGSSYGISLRSAPGQGTTVTICCHWQVETLQKSAAEGPDFTGCSAAHRCTFMLSFLCLLRFPDKPKEMPQHRGEDATYGDNH